MHDAYKQGELDSLCGLYAVVNAFRILFPESEREDHYELFIKLVRLTRTKMSVSTICFGVGPRQMHRLVSFACKQFARNGQWRTMYEVIKSGKEQDAWEQLRDAVSRDSVAIVGLGGAIEHWTVVSDINRAYATFSDSGSVRGLSNPRLRRKGRSDIHLDGSAIFAISRMCASPDDCLA